MDGPVLHPADGGYLVGLRVSPAATRTRVTGLYGDRLKVQVASPPERNRANSELEQAFASWLGLPSDYVSVHSGHKSRDKKLLVRGMTRARLRQSLVELAG